VYDGSSVCGHPGLWFPLIVADAMSTASATISFPIALGSEHTVETEGRTWLSSDFDSCLLKMGLKAALCRWKIWI
jgi:hypothetical protein